jgi:hypothetical protein
LKKDIIYYRILYHHTESVLEVAVRRIALARSGAFCVKTRV